jgi:hypothetical protein
MSSAFPRYRRGARDQPKQDGRRDADEKSEVSFKRPSKQEGWKSNRVAVQDDPESPLGFPSLTP